MSPIQTLMEEHRLIERMIGALSVYARRVEGGEALPRADLDGFVRFVQGFADTHHHGKEEDILFRAMTDQGMPREMGPLGVMYAEHEEGRGYTGSLAELTAGDAEAAWTEAERTQLAWAANSYASLLLAHIQKEDQVLYPMADQMLPEAVWQAIERAFEIFEADAGNAARAAELRAVAATLTERYA
jgi:hemerythrin-like domain-containing protein